MADTDRDDYLPPSQLARMFGVHARTVERWGNADLVRTRDNPRRKGARLYHRADVERLAHTMPPPLQPEADAAPSEPSTELVPLSDLLEALNRKDVQLADANDKLQRVVLEVGRLQGQLEAQQRLLEAAEDDRQRRITAETERDRLRRDIERLPWWVRIFFLRNR